MTPADKNLPGIWRRIARQLGRLRNDNRAVAMVEFAVVMPILVLLILPLVDLGMGFYVKTQVATAAQAGAQYAFVNGWNSGNISTAVTSATGMGTTIQASPAPVLACGCADGTTFTPPLIAATLVSDCASRTPCTGARLQGVYVTVFAQTTYTPLFSYLIFSGSTTISTSSTVRIQ